MKVCRDVPSTTGLGAGQLHWGLMKDALLVLREFNYLISQYSLCKQVKFVENHANVSNATAAFIRFFIAAGVMLPFADWTKTEVLIAGEHFFCRSIQELVYRAYFVVFRVVFSTGIKEVVRCSS